MSANAVNDLARVWQEVRTWPPGERWALATRILQSLQQEDRAVAVSQERKEALSNLIGIWKTVNPPSDEEVEQIVEEERMEKYG
jgi:hypothetical protein